LSQASKLTSARVAGIVPQPLHWNRPLQSPVWQWPTPLLLKVQPVRPQNRVLRLLGVLIVTLWPGRSTQPVAASGVLGFGAAATQIVCDSLLTNVTARRGALAAGCDAAVTVAAVAAAGVAVTAVARGAALAPVTGPASPAVIAVSIAAVPTALITVLRNRPGRGRFIPSNITGILHVVVRSSIGDGRRHREITENGSRFCAGRCRGRGPGRVVCP
jgi:hypothetical protein